MLKKNKNKIEWHSQPDEGRGWQIQDEQEQVFVMLQSQIKHLLTQFLNYVSRFVLG